MALKVTVESEMKVLIVSATYPPMSSGGADYVFRLCHGLASIGFSVDVITTKNEEIIATNDVHMHPVMSSWSWVELPRLMQNLKAIAPDVINLHFSGILYNDHPMITFLPLLAKLVVPSARLVTLFEAPVGVRAYRHQFIIRGVHKVFAMLCKSIDYSYGLLLSGSESIIALSERHRAALARHYSAIYAKSYIMPPPPLVRLSPANAQSRERGRAALNLSPEHFLITYFGYLYPGKGAETLLKAFATVASKDDRARLALIGGVNELIVRDLGRPNYRQELMQLADSLGIAGRVFWSGDFAPNSLEPSLYLRASDLCALPFDAGVCLSNSSFATAAAHGLPIITTACQTLESPFIGGENVMLCPPCDPSRLAQTALMLMEDEQLRQQLGSNVLILARHWFSWEQTLHHTAQLFSFEGNLESARSTISLLPIPATQQSPGSVTEKTLHVR
jgi:glycosyltransferase involved in cell wall biosynthesis